MRYRLVSTCKLGRVGIISDITRLPNYKMETPNVVLYSSGGSIPHLTYEVLQMLTTDTLPVQYPLDNLYHAIDAIDKFDNSLSSFVGLPEYFSYCILQDPNVKIIDGYHRSDAATIWSQHGKQWITWDRYMDLMESFEPDMYVSMSDYITDISSSKKRCYNAFKTTQRSLAYCHDRHCLSPILKDKGFIATICGGYDSSLRELSAKYVSTLSSAVGYLLDGFYVNGRTVNQIPFQSIENILTHTLKYLPEDRLRIIHGAWEPKRVLKMVRMGVDLFDTSLAVQSTNNGRALNYSLNIDELDSENKNESNRENPTSFSNCNGSDDGSKNTKIKYEDTEKKEIECLNSYSIPLFDEKYSEDFKPLVENCICLTCRKHTRAYIHHLLRTKELLASVLLTLHNLHHHIEFFRRIRKHLRSNGNATQNL